MKSLWDGPLIQETHFKGLGAKREGKVRDIYDLGKSFLLVATDRISAFDLVLPDGIPGKGYVLTQLSKFWFEWLMPMEDIVPHHLITVAVEEFPEPCQLYREVLTGRSMLVRKAEPLPVECIVRGYLSGSAWKEYRQHGAVCGQTLPGGLVESDRLPEPIFTPSTKEAHGHDVNISFGQMEQVIGVALAEEVRAVSLKIYRRAAAFAEMRGIIIADTKLEFGLDPETQQLILIDEVLTPDSSRFWPKDRHVPGEAPPSFDKQYVRDYLDSIDWNRKPPVPHLPQEIIQKTSSKYFEALSRLTHHEAGGP